MPSSQEEQLLNPDTEQKKCKKFQWYWAPVYCAFWFLIFYVSVIPSYYNYPKTLLIRDESQHIDQFIAERAELQLMGLAKIGVKFAGTISNEVLAVNFLLIEIDKIKAQARLDLYDIEVDVQHVSGDFALGPMTINYQNVANVIVKLAPKNVTRASYLLLNSHFDSEMDSPGVGDDGVMVAIMLETLRVISKSEKPLKNPVVFLFNGAEEAILLASHGFITKHRWAQYCKAVINLDSAGSGGREILFQTGPNHPWLLKHYKTSVPRPYANTIAEELFQNRFIPSDTDYRIFRDFGHIPGLDMAHTLNGYVYHTKFDSYSSLERQTCQTTGENILALTWALANAPELENPEDYAEGNTIFFDYLGWFLISYSTTAGIIINVTTSIVACVTIFASVFLMSRDANAALTVKQTLLRFFYIFLVQLSTIVVAVIAAVLIAYAIDSIDASECWFSETWLVFGLYFCPMFFFMCLLPAEYMRCTKVWSKMRLNDSLACFMHAHCLILIILCLFMTGVGIRSAYFPMIAIFFYTISVILNIGNRLWGKNCFYLPIHLLCQLFPYWFYTYLTFAFLQIFIPIQGRNGPASKPDLLIGGLCIITCIHFSGFILPILHKFRKSKTFISLFGALCLIFIIIACLPIGFPYKKDVAVQRVSVSHAERICYDEHGNAYTNVSGFYIQMVDRRINTLQNTVLKNAEELNMAEIACGPPSSGISSHWIKAPSPFIPLPTELKLTSTNFTTPTRVRYEFSLKSADRSIIYVTPYPNTTVVDWSFDTTPLRKNYRAPYSIYRTYAMVEEPLEFWIEIERNSTSYEDATLELGVESRFSHHEVYYTEEFKEYLKQFPVWSYPVHYFTAFESRIF